MNKIVGVVLLVIGVVLLVLGMQEFGAFGSSISERSAGVPQHAPGIF